MNTYIGFFNGKQVEVQADTLYGAKTKAVEHFKPRRSQAHMVHVHLAAVGNEPVVHVADF